jgi:hypothetical protein
MLLFSGDTVDVLPFYCGFEDDDPVCGFDNGDWRRITSPSPHRTNSRKTGPISGSRMMEAQYNIENICG